MSEETWFSHKKLEVYQEAIKFIPWLSPLLEQGVRMGDVKDKLDRASTSIALNIAGVTGNALQRTAVVSLTPPTGRRWNVRRVWMFWRPKEDSLAIRSDPARMISKESCEC